MYFGALVGVTISYFVFSSSSLISLLTHIIFDDPGIENFSSLYVLWKKADLNYLNIKIFEDVRRHNL
jgi:hypothetical protein